MENKAIGQIFPKYFFSIKFYPLILTKKWVAIHFGVFFTNSSGHPVSQISAVPKPRQIHITQ
jgi:hypothetical protein